MSSFSGPLGQFLACLKGISVDNFAGVNLNSSTFFLSHFHLDHMVGLKSLEFLKCLERRPGANVYMTDLTKRMLLRERNADGVYFYKNLEPYVVALPVGNSVNVVVPGIDNSDDFTVCVTLFDALHCIGSVMFLFEYGEENVKRLLYTGDIRLCATDMNIDKMPNLYTDDGILKNIDILCIDTTFCHMQAAFIPSISTSAKCLRDFVRRFVHERPGNRVLLNLPAKIGHEQLLECCFTALDGRTKVHVSDSVFYRYLAIPDMIRIVSDSVPCVPVHACCNAAASLALANGTPNRIWWCPNGLPNSCTDDSLAIIRPSIMHFADDKIGPEQVFYRDSMPPSGCSHRTYHLCYSAHSSFNELKSIVTLLRPRHIIPNVRPMGSSLKEAQSLLEKVLELALDVPPSVKPIADTDKGPEELSYIPKRRKTEPVVHDDGNNCDSFDGLDFTPDVDIAMPKFSAKKLVRGKLVTVPPSDSKTTKRKSPDDVISISSEDEGDH